MTRRFIASDSRYERVIGFSRAVRVGNMVTVGGTASIAVDGSTVGVGDAGAQTHRIMEIIETALDEAGATLGDIVRTRTMLVDINDWKAVTDARSQYLRDVKPVDTIVQVVGFVDPEWLVEIEVDAVVDE